MTEMFLHRSLLTLLQSETCGLSIPEIELVLQAGTLGGRFTTLEGILDQVYEELSEKVFAGDSADADDRSNFGKFLSNLKAVSQRFHVSFPLLF
jgi:zinc finger protein